MSTTARLPNPNISHDEHQTLTLREALVHQRQTNEFTKNTDINTFRGNIETKEGFAKMTNSVSGGATLRDIHVQSQISTENITGNQTENSENQQRAFGDAFNALLGPFERLTQNLRGEGFKTGARKALTAAGEEINIFAMNMKAGGERFHTGLKELTNGIGAMGPAMNMLKTAIFKGVAVFNIFAGALQMAFGVLNTLSFGLLGKATNKIGSMASNAYTSAKDKVKSTFGFGGKENEMAEADKEFVDASTEYQNLMGQSIGGDVAENTVNLSGQSIMDLAEAIRTGKSGRMQERLDKKRKDSMFKLESKRNKALATQKAKNERKRVRTEKLNQLKLFAIRALPWLGIFAALGLAVMAFKDNAITALTQAGKTITQNLEKIFTNLKNMLSKLFPKMFPKTPGGNDVKKTDPKKKPPTKAPTTPGTNVGKEVGEEVAKKGTMQVGKEVAKQVIRKAPVIGAGAETILDASSNKKKLDLITAAYNNKSPVIDDGQGGFRPMTKEEYEMALKANQANNVGSVGRGAGALAGATAGAYIGSIVPGIGTVVGGIVGGLIGGIFGGKAGDAVATDIAGDMIGVENPQQMIDTLTSNIESNLSGDALAKLQGEVNADTGAGTTIVNNNVVQDNKDMSQSGSAVYVDSGQDSNFAYSTSN